MFLSRQNFFFAWTQNMCLVLTNPTFGFFSCVCSPCLVGQDWEISWILFVLVIRNCNCFPWTKNCLFFFFFKLNPRHKPKWNPASSKKYNYAICLYFPSPPPDHHAKNNIKKHMQTRKWVTILKLGVSKWHK